MALIASFYVPIKDIQLWNANGEVIDVFVKNLAIDEVSQRLVDAAIQFEVIVDDYQKLIDEENPSTEEMKLLQSQNGECHSADHFFYDSNRLL